MVMRARDRLSFPLLAVLSAMLAMFLAGSPLSAQVPVLLDFEDFAAGTAIFNQYDGLTFVGADVLNFDGSHPVTIFKPALATVSPTQALKSAFQFICEFCGTQFLMKFDVPQSRVSFSLGLADGSTVDLGYFVRGFDVDPTTGTAVPLAQVNSACLGTSPTTIDSPVEIDDGAGRIRFVLVSLVQCTSPTDPLSGPTNATILLDNLLYDRPLNPPPRESDPPVINITFPANGSTVEGVAPGQVALTLHSKVTETAIYSMSAVVNGRPPVPVHYSRIDAGSFNASLEIDGTGGLVEGANHVVLTALDFDRPQNQGTASVDFTYHIRPFPPTDIVPIAVEVTQSIDPGPRSLTGSDTSGEVDGYDLLIQNDPPLLSGKPTVVRVYAAATGVSSAVANVPAVMTVFRDFCTSNCLVSGGLPPITKPGTPNLQGITVPVAGSPDANPGTAAATLSKSWNFLIPADWTTSALVVEITVNSGAYNNFPQTAAVFECQSGSPLTCTHNNKIRLHLPFEAGPQITVHPVLLHVTGTFNGNTFNDVTPSEAQVQAIFQQINELYPAIVIRGQTIDRTITPDQSNDDLTNFMEGFDSNDGHEMFIGVFPGDQGAFRENVDPDDSRFRIAGTGVVGGRGAWGNANDPIDPAHELGHNIGFDHWGCENGVNEDECGVFPISHAGIGGFGFDIANWKVIPPGDNSANDTPHEHDFMSYGQLCSSFGGGPGCDLGEWVSWYTYDILLNHPAIDSYDTDDPPVLMIRGRISADGGRLTPLPVYLTAINHRPRTSVPEDEVETIHTIEGHDTSGNVVLLHNFEPKKVTAHPMPDTFFFDEAVAVPPRALGRISFFHGASKIGEIRPPVHIGKLAVSITSPTTGTPRWPGTGKNAIEWVTGPVGVKVAALVQYSADGGATRITLARDFLGTQLTINGSELPGGDKAFIFVTVSDGFNSASDLAGPFSVPARHPVVQILEPADGGQALAGLPLTLTGMGFDRQELLKDSAFQWSSDLDGPLGTGRLLTVTDLKLGTHTLTLTATDSLGLNGSDAIQFQVVALGTRPRFHRGDVNNDGALDLSDGVSVLSFLFTGGATPSCRETADADNSGEVDISDGVYILRFLFLGGDPPADPGPPARPCGVDTDPAGSPGDLGCAAYDHC
jgi:hypothetical protein